PAAPSSPEALRRNSTGAGLNMVFPAKYGGMEGSLALPGQFKRLLHFPGHLDEKPGQIAKEPDVEPSSLRQDPAKLRQQGAVHGQGAFARRVG
ncbi:MAG: hypothetical protein ACKPKO_53500, partial [Candidatus Fonsibacter sp.]